MLFSDLDNVSVWLGADLRPRAYLHAGVLAPDELLGLAEDLLALETVVRDSFGGNAPWRNVD